jgi:hypothetical protein
VKSPVDIIVEAPWSGATRGEQWRALLYIPEAPRPFGGCGATPWIAIAMAGEAYQRWVARVAAGGIVAPIADATPAVVTAPSRVPAPAVIETDPLKRSGPEEAPLFQRRRQRGGGKWR